MSTTDTERYVRTTLLTFEGGVWICKQILFREVDRIAGSPTLDALLQSNKKQLIEKRNHKELTRRQFQTLFPASSIDTDVDKWDLQLLIKLILFLFEYSLPGRECDDLREILQIRNEVVCHATQPSMPEHEFNTHWETLTQSIYSLTFDGRTKQYSRELVKRIKVEPLDLQSSIEKISQLCRNDEHIDNVLATLEKVESTVNAVATGVVNANRKLDDANSKQDDANRKLDDANRKLDDANRKQDDANRKQDDANRKLDEVLAGVQDLKRINEESQCRVDIPPLTGTVCVSGNIEKDVQISGDILQKVLRSAIGKAKDPTDNDSVLAAVHQTLDDLKTHGGHADSVDTGSILLNIRCHTLMDLTHFLSLFRTHGHAYHLVGIEEALNTSHQVDVKVELVLPEDTIDMLRGWIEDGVQEYKRHINLGIKCDSVDAAVDVIKYLQSDESANRMNQIAEAVSGVVDDQIKIEAAPDVEGFSHALRANIASTMPSKPSADTCVYGSPKNEISAPLSDKLEQSADAPSNSLSNVLNDQRETHTTTKNLSKHGTVEAGGTNTEDETHDNSDGTMATYPTSSFRSILLSSDEATPDFGVVAAIDFGTSTSGFAFGFWKKGSSGIKLAKIQLNKWQLGSASSSVDKAPTTLLLKPDRSFDSFGFKAEDKFAKLSDTKREKGWWYFQRFKMELYKSKLSRDLMLHDAEGKPMPAHEVISSVIAHLKTCILAEVKRQNPGITDDSVLYVLTVPAIWSDAAKQFMREAATAHQVGIKDTQLQLVLEPEAASLFCRERESRVVKDEQGKATLEALEVGHRYIIIDLGGGTADIATHKVIEDGKLHEIDYARGDNLGGQLFNSSFITFLSDLFGEDLFKQWASSKHGEYLRLLRAIEGVKWEVSDSDDEVLFEIPHTLLKRTESSAVGFVQKNLSQSKYSTSVELIDENQFLLKNDFVRSFFDTITKGVVKHISDISEQSDNIETVFLVGGLAKSDYVRRAVQTAFTHYTFIVPEDPGVAVLKGAVLLGNKPQTIAGRIANYSYGIRVNKSFIEGEHDERYKFTLEGEVKCDNIFSNLITKGQVLKYGDFFTVTSWLYAKLPETKQRTVETYLYQSTSTNPVYTTEPGCTKLGGIEESPPTGGWPDRAEFKLKIVVGEAEFQFYVTDSLGRKYETTVDFLSHRDTE